MLLQSLAPLVEQRLPVHKDERGDRSLRERGTRDDGLAGTRRCDENPEIVAAEVVERGLLFCLQAGPKLDADRRRVGSADLNLQMAAGLLDQGLTPYDGAR